MKKVKMHHIRWSVGDKNKEIITDDYQTALDFAVKHQFNKDYHYLNWTSYLVNKNDLVIEDIGEEMEFVDIISIKGSKYWIINNPDDKYDGWYVTQDGKMFLLEEEVHHCMDFRNDKDFPQP